MIESIGGLVSWNTLWWQEFFFRLIAPSTFSYKTQTWFQLRVSDIVGEITNLISLVPQPYLGPVFATFGGMESNETTPLPLPYWCQGVFLGGALPHALTKVTDTTYPNFQVDLEKACSDGKVQVGGTAITRHSSAAMYLFYRSCMCPLGRFSH